MAEQMTLKVEPAEEGPTRVELVFYIPSGLSRADEWKAVAVECLLYVESFTRLAAGLPAVAGRS